MVEEDLDSIVREGERMIGRPENRGALTSSLRFRICDAHVSISDYRQLVHLALFHGKVRHSYKSRRKQAWHAPVAMYALSSLILLPVVLAVTASVPCLS